MMGPVDGRDDAAATQDLEGLREMFEDAAIGFKLLVEAVKDYAIFMLDPHGHVMSWNVGAERIKGYRADEVVGQHFRIFYPEEKRASRHPEHELFWALRDGSYEEEGWRVRKDGSYFWANVVITAVYDDRNRHIGFAKVTRDMTDRRSILEELRLANSRLRDVAERQAEFLAVTAHELRGPVGVLAGSAQTLAEYSTELGEGERAALAEGATSSAARLRRMVADLLTAARLESSTLDLRLDPVNVSEIVAASALRARRDRREARIVVDAPDRVTVRGDGDRLGQAVDNLIANALRHGAQPVDIRVVQIQTERVEVQVRDSGSGVPLQLQPRLFQRFVSGGAEGTGLGLFIVRELARAHGGDASYRPDTERGRSGAFVISLPAAGGGAPSVVGGDGTPSVP